MEKNFAFCLNDGYVDYCYVSILSILENNKSEGGVNIHILSDYIAEGNKRRLITLAGKYHANVLFYNIDKTQFSGVNLKWSVYNWFRIVLPQNLPQQVDRVLYLDCDTIVTSDLEDLFSYDLAGNSIAAVIDSESRKKETFDRLGYDMAKKYICSGVLLMNLQYWRKNNITEKILSYGKSFPEKCLFADQCAINYVCQDSKVLLPLQYGVINSFFKRHDLYDLNEVREALVNPKIIHFAGNAPWKYRHNYHTHRKYWWMYKSKARIGNKIELKYFQDGLKYKLSRFVKLLTGRSGNGSFDREANFINSVTFIETLELR